VTSRQADRRPFDQRLELRIVGGGGRWSEAFLNLRVPLTPTL